MRRVAVCRSDLKDVLSSIKGQQEFCERCRPNESHENIIQWIIEAQCNLLASLRHHFTPSDFGLPRQSDEGGSRESFDGTLPSIKMKKETIDLKKAKPGPHMHDP